MKNTAIVLAGGQGKRMNSKVHKQYLKIGDRPVLAYSLGAFQDSSIINEVILVCGEGEEEYCRREIVERYGFDKVVSIVPGGKERYHSVYEGLKCCEDCTYVFIHDGARPFVDEEIIERAYRDVSEYHAAVVGMPVKDTIKMADDNLNVESTPDRARLWMIQTPQVFDYQLVRSAYDMVLAGDPSGITDDAMVVERMTGNKVHLTEGSYKNIKITTPEDLLIAEAYIR